MLDNECVRRVGKVELVAWLNLVIYHGIYQIGEGNCRDIPHADDLNGWKERIRGVHRFREEASPEDTSC